MAAQHYNSNNRKMHGGRLHHGCHALWQNKLIAAFGSSFYLFDSDSQTCRGRFDIGHHLQIIAMKQLQNQQFLAVDHQGLCIKFTLARHKISQKEHNFTVLQKYELADQKGKKCKEPSQILINSQGDVYYLSQHDGKLRRYSSQTKTAVTISHGRSFVKLLHLGEKWIVGLVEQNKVVCISVNEDKKQRQYVHANQITAAVVTPQSLILGDKKGKIYVINNFLTKANTHFHLSKLQWHTGPVNCLFVSGQYLYSAGEESVIVLWHLKDLSRDFLPRVGTAIHSLWVNQLTNQILCGMSDNSLKMIDLGNDKQIKHFKLISDPQGYAPDTLASFSSQSIHYNATSDQIVMNGLPGRLQSINFRANGQHSQIEVIPRNLINQLDNNTLQPNRITNFSFSSDWSAMLACIQESFRCSLKFYRRKFGNEFELVSKVQNPHRSKIDGCFSLPTSLSTDEFVTFSSSDRSVKIWREHREKKRSIIQADEVYWRCQQDITYRQMTPVSVDCQLDMILVLFSQDIVLFRPGNNRIFEKSNNFFIPDCKTQKIWILSQSNPKSTNQTLTILLIDESHQGFKIVQWNLSQNSMKVISQLHKKTISKVEVSLSEQNCAIFIQEANQYTHILVWDRKSCQFTSSYKCDKVITAGFWRGQQLILVSDNLLMQSLDGKDFVNFHQVVEGGIDEETAEIPQTIYAAEVDIFGLSERWIGRQTVRNNKKTEQTIGSLHLLADCNTALDELTGSMLI